MPYNEPKKRGMAKFCLYLDVEGNLVEKGNMFNISGDTVTYTATSGEGVEYWQYTYDLLNRLTQVKKNSTLMAGYGYDPEGLWVVKKVYQNGVLKDTIHYVFEGTEPIFQKNISTGKVKSYVYALVVTSGPG